MKEGPVSWERNECGRKEGMEELDSWEEWEGDCVSVERLSFATL